MDFAVPVTLHTVSSAKTERWAFPASMFIPINHRLTTPWLISH
jgi:hypothetical protein